jgi:hypothetical protein
LHDFCNKLNGLFTKLLKSVIFLAIFKDNTGLMIDTYTPVDGGKTQIALFMEDTDE